MKKPIISLVAAAVFAVGLSGCSTPAANTDPGEINGEISYAFWDPNQEPLVDELIAEFNKQYPEVEVTPTVVPFGQYWTTLQTQASSDTLPDVFWMNMPNFQLYASNGQLAPIDDLVASGQIDPSKYPENLTEFYTFDGTRYAVPKDIDTNAMWLNTSLFEAAGVPLPDEDWTYDDFRATAAALREGLSSLDAYGVAFYPGGQTTWYSSIFAYDGEVITADGKSGWAEPGTIEGLQVWADVIADGSSPTMDQLFDTLADQWFLNGKAAMFPSIAGASIALIGSSPNVGDFTAHPLPRGDREATVAHALSNVVSAQSKNLAAAQAFQAFLASEQAQRMQSAAGIALSAYEGTSGAFLDSHPDLNLQTFVDAIEYAYPYPASKDNAWANEEMTLLLPALAGQISVKDVAAELDAMMNKALAAE